jgi:hypothetical protein
MGSNNLCHCIGPCALAAMTLCIGYAMNRAKIYKEEDDTGKFIGYLFIGCFAMPCGVTQEYTHMASRNKVSN